MTVVLTRDYAKNVVARAVPGAFYDRDTKAFVLKDPTPRAAAVALRLFPDVATAHPELVELRASLAQEVRPLDNASEFATPIGAPNVRKVLADEGHEFYEYQSIDLGYLAAVLTAHGGAYVGWSRGLGKSLGACALVEELECQRVLVVAPNTAKRAVWEPELHRFLPDYEVVVLRNSKSQREKDLGYVRQLIQAEQPFALVVHYESLAIIETERGGGWKKLGEWDMVIADEAHRIANPKAKMTKALKKVPARYKLALSGSIIQNHAEELFSPLQWLFPKLYKSRWRDWNDRFLDYVDSGYSRVCVGVKIEMLDELRKELGVFMTVRTKEDELDLPPRTEETRYVELSPAQRKAYDDLRESCIAELDDGSVVTAEDGLVLLTRLRQVASGLDLLTGELSDSSKLDFITEMILDNSDEAYVVFAWYRASAYALADRLTRLGVETYVVTGDVKQDDRARYIQEFQAGQRRVFIGTIKTLGESVNLMRANNAVFIDRSFNPSDNDQSADRIWRIGQEKPVLVTHVVAKGTVDELKVMPILSDKSALRRLILGG
jgi:SNF2 family DNA or RNA helicase